MFNNFIYNLIIFKFQFICLGSHWGVIYILDHQGNCIEDKEIKAHSVGINQISIDFNGEFIATCSDDGRVFIHSLFSKENNVNLNLERLVKTIALDPNYCKYGSNRRFLTGNILFDIYFVILKRYLSIIISLI